MFTALCCIAFFLYEGCKATGVKDDTEFIIAIIFIAVSAIVWSCLYYKWEQDAKKNFT